MSSLLEHRHGEKTHFSRNEKERFSLSQMNNVELARTLSWRENGLFKERKRTKLAGYKRYTNKDCSVSEFYRISPKL